MAFKERLLYGLQKIKDIITEMISTHNNSADAHAANIKGRISTHNLDKTAHPNGFTQCVNITSTNTATSPTTNGDHKDMGDVSFLAKDGTTILGNVGVDLLRDTDGKVYRVVYLQTLSDTTDQNKHATITLKNTLDGKTKLLHSDATLQTIATDKCTATWPTLSNHIANANYVDKTMQNHRDEVSSHSMGQVVGLVSELAGKAEKNHTHTASSIGAIGFPNYASKSLIVSSGNTLNWTATNDGWLQIAIRYAHDAYGTLLVATDTSGSNATAIGGTGGQDYDMDIQLVPCKKGYVYKYVNGTVDGATWSSALAGGIVSVYYIPFL